MVPSQLITRRITGRMIWEIDDLIFMQEVFAQAPERRSLELRLAASNYLCIFAIWERQGDCARLVQSLRCVGGDRACVLSSLCTAIASCQFAGSPIEAHALILPRAALTGGLEWDLARTREIEFPVSLRALLTDYLVGLTRTLPRLSPKQIRTLSGPTAALVAAGIAPTLKSIAIPSATTIIWRAAHAVKQNIGRPKFGPKQLGQVLGMSRSNLYRHFSEFGGVASFIRRVRLHEALARLHVRGSSSPIHQIAIDVGFTEHSTFSRAFRREFGTSPRQSQEWYSDLSHSSSFRTDAASQWRLPVGAGRVHECRARNSIPRHP